MTDAERVLEIAARLMNTNLGHREQKEPAINRAHWAISDAEALIKAWRTRTAPPEPQDVSDELLGRVVGAKLCECATCVSVIAEVRSIQRARAAKREGE